MQDLPKILRMSESVEIEVYADTFAYTNLRLHPWLLAIWRSTGFTKESAWDAYHKLQPIFERRKLRLNAIFHALPAWSFALFSVAGLLIVEVTAKLGSVAMLSVLILLVGLVVSVARHSVVLPRNSWDPAPPWTYAKERLIPVLLGAALGIFGTILGIYLKHKIWP